MKRTLSLASLLALVCAPLWAGVVYEIEVTDHSQSSPKTESTEAAVEGKNLKMEITAGRSGSNGTAIYRGDRREMVVVDHDDKSYVVIDEAAVEEIAGQIGSAMSQVQEALKNVPEDQRAMMEKMLKERMPAATQPTARPSTELRKTGERDTKNGYPCVKYEVLRDGRKLRELWVTDWSNVEGGSEVAGAFQEMAAFFEEMMTAFSAASGMPGLLSEGDGFFEHFKELDGFPVVTRELDADGSLESESTLRSSERRTLDPADFEPPAGYKRRQMFPGG